MPVGLKKEGNAPGALVCPAVLAPLAAFVDHLKGWGSNSHGARPVHLIITMIQWIRTSRLSIKNCLSGEEFEVWV